MASSLVFPYNLIEFGYSFPKNRNEIKSHFYFFESKKCRPTDWFE